jgi:hypothetical protein
MFAAEDAGWEKAAVTGGWVNGAEKFACGPRKPEDQQVSKLPISSTSNMMLAQKQELQLELIR